VHFRRCHTHRSYCTYVVSHRVALCTWHANFCPVFSGTQPLWSLRHHCQNGRCKYTTHTQICMPSVTNTKRKQYIYISQINLKRLDCQRHERIHAGELFCGTSTPHSRSHYHTAPPCLSPPSPNSHYGNAAPCTPVAVPKARLYGIVLQCIGATIVDGSWGRQSGADIVHTACFSTAISSCCPFQVHNTMH
jgi:hypothetical protein